MIAQNIILMFTSTLFSFLQVSGTDSFPRPLSAKEEYALFREMKNGSSDAREKLICHNLRLVTHIVRKYYLSANNQEDLISIGTIGLIKAVDTFNPENGARFATYASRCLQNEILMHFRTQKKLGAEISIQETIDTDHEGNPLTYIDIIAQEDTIADDLDKKQRIAKLKSLILTTLTPREREIIEMRYGLCNKPPVTQRVCAQKLGISRSYVSRIEKNVLEKLRGPMSDA